MRKIRAILLLILWALLISPSLTAFSESELNQLFEEAQLPTPTPKVEVVDETDLPASPTSISEPNNTAEIEDPRSAPTPTPEPTPDPFSALYNCEMELTFINGPLETRSTSVDVLGEDYFEDKGDKFAPGKGTAIYYEAQRYFILHSSYVNGNVLKPMEAEFIRHYLENWGNTDPEVIQENIDNLIGSEVIWICNGKSAFKTTITGITRLSHAASERLWLEPTELEAILTNREGLDSEWVGEIQPTGEPVIHLGFCGWGPNNLEVGRFTYYRYLLQFTVDALSHNFDT